MASVLQLTRQLTRPLGHAVRTHTAHWRAFGSRSRPDVLLRALVLRPTGTGETDHLDGEAGSRTGAFVLPPGKHMVGRTDASEVVIPIPTVSTRHAVLIVDDQGGAVVTDLQSTNGTTVDGLELEPLKPYELHTGSDLIFGDAALARYSVELTATDDLAALEQSVTMAAAAPVAAEAVAVAAAAAAGGRSPSPEAVHYAVAPEYRAEGESGNMFASDTSELTPVSVLDDTTSDGGDAGAGGDSGGDAGGSD